MKSGRAAENLRRKDLPALNEGYRFLQDLYFAICRKSDNFRSKPVWNLKNK